MREGTRPTKRRAAAPVSLRGGRRPTKPREARRRTGLLRRLPPRNDRAEAHRFSDPRGAPSPAPAASPVRRISRSRLLAVDETARTLQMGDHPPAAVEGPARVLLVDQRARQQVFRRIDARCLPAVPASAVHPGQFALPRYRQHRPPVDPAHSSVSTHRPDLSQSGSIFNRPIFRIRTISPA